jgi:pimeloyl-ACP methyl ester carboxylesterase
MSTKAEGDSEEAKAARDETAAIVREKGSSALIDRMLGKLISERASEAITEQVTAMIRAIPAEAAAADSEAMRDRPDSTADLASISVPAVVIQGEEDQLMTLEGGRAMAERIPVCSFVSIPGAGHFTPLENPDAVNDALRQFLSSVTTM